MFLLLLYNRQHGKHQSIEKGEKVKKRQKKEEKR